MNNQTILAEELCDGKNDCPGGEDEEKCVLESIHTLGLISFAVYLVLGALLHGSKFNMSLYNYQFL